MVREPREGAILPDDEVCLDAEARRTRARLQQDGAFCPLAAAAALAFHQVHRNATAIVSRRDYDNALGIAAAALSRLICIYTLRDPREGRVAIAVDLTKARFALGATQLRGAEGTIGELWVARGEMDCALPLIRRTGLPFSFAETRDLPHSLRQVVVRQEVLRRALQVVELAALQGAPEHPAGQENEGDRDRDEEVEAFHGCSLCSGRRALSSTMRELAPMPSAASQGPIQPSAASGSAAAL
jgi:hypothetical protein